MGRTLWWTVGLGSGMLRSEARLIITPARVCLCVSLIFSLCRSIWLPVSVCAPVRPRYLCAPPLPSLLLGPLPCPARPSPRRPYPLPRLQVFPGPQPRTPRRSPAATCPASASACFAWRPSRTTPARPPEPSSSPRCKVTCAPSRPARNR